MKREEVLLFIEVGGEYKFFENGCNTVGKVIKVSDTALILQRQDGTKKIVSFDVIQGIDECAEE